jgi:hypothetical protein
MVSDSRRFLPGVNGATRRQGASGSFELGLTFIVVLVWMDRVVFTRLDGGWYCERKGEQLAYPFFPLPFRITHFLWVTRPVQKVRLVHHKSEGGIGVVLPILPQ